MLDDHGPWAGQKRRARDSLKLKQTACCFFFAGVLATLAVTHFATAPSAPAVLSSTGRPKAKGENAFVLSVGLRFGSRAAARSLLREWGRAANWCFEHEPFLYHYEMAQSDKDPLVYQIYERYASKADYLGAHRSSPAFKAFRPRMKALQDAGEVNVSGSSFVEIGLGFT